MFLNLCNLVPDLTSSNTNGPILKPSDHLELIRMIRKFPKGVYQVVLDIFVMFYAWFWKNIVVMSKSIIYFSFLIVAAQMDRYRHYIGHLELIHTTRKYPKGVR